MREHWQPVAVFWSALMTHWLQGRMIRGAASAWMRRACRDFKRQPRADAAALALTPAR